MRVPVSATIVAMSCVGLFLADVAFGESGYQFELVVAKDGKAAVPVAEPPKPLGDVELKARVRMVDGKPCELFAFREPAELLRGEWKLVIRDTHSRPSAFKVPTEAVLALIVCDDQTKRRLGEVKPARNVKFADDSQTPANDPACACQPSPSRTSAIDFGKPFDDISGDLQLALTCDDEFKKGKVKKVLVEAYLQFVTDGKPCCCYHKLDNSLTITLGDKAP